MNTGHCIDYEPEVYTTFLSDSVWSWVQTIVFTDGFTGKLGTGVGRVEFSNCKDIGEKTKEDNKPSISGMGVSFSLY